MDYNSLKDLMPQREEAKKIAALPGSSDDRRYYCKLRNQVTKMNSIKKRTYYQKRISDSGQR